MSDPRYTDPRYSQSQFSDPVGRRSDGAGTWGWVAGITVIALIAIFLIAGGKSVSNNSASNSAPTMAIPHGPTPSTTGMGGPSPTTTPVNPPAKGPAPNNR